MWLKTPQRILLLATIAAGVLNGGPVIKAVRKGDLKTVQRLLDAGEDPNEKTSNNTKVAVDKDRTALLVAIFEKKDEIARLLIDRGADVNLREWSGFGPLHVAAGTCNPDLVRHLLDHEASVDLRMVGWRHTKSEATDITPLGFLVRQSSSVARVVHTERFQKRFQKQLSKDPKAMQEFNEAGGLEGYVEKVATSIPEPCSSAADILLSAGADINSIDFAGWTPLMHTAHNGHLGWTRFLLSKGAYPIGSGWIGEEARTPSLVGSPQDTVGWSPLMLAAASPSAASRLFKADGEEAEPPEDVEIVQAFMKTEPAQKGQALTKAAARGEVQAVRDLLSDGADPNWSDVFGYTPLIAASEGGRLQVVQELLKAGADVGMRRLPYRSAETLRALGSKGEAPAGPTVVDLAARRKIFEQLSERQSRVEAFSSISEMVAFQNHYVVREIEVGGEPPEGDREKVATELQAAEETQSHQCFSSHGGSVWIFGWGDRKCIVPLPKDVVDRAVRVALGTFQCEESEEPQPGQPTCKMANGERIFVATTAQEGATELSIALEYGNVFYGDQRVNLSNAILRHTIDALESAAQ